MSHLNLDRPEAAPGIVTVCWSIRRNQRAWEFKELMTKGTMRTLPLPSFLVAGPRAHRTQQPEARLAAGGRWPDWNLVFPNPRGRPQDQNDVRRRFQAKLKLAGLPHKRCYGLRHSRGTFLHANGVSPGPSWSSWATR